MTALDQGIIYIATGDQHRIEAVRNMSASQPYLNGCESVLFTDEPSLIPDNIFSRVLRHPSSCFSYRDKILPLIDLPFEVNLFLDSDARLIDDVSNLFSSFGNADFSAVYAPVRHPPGWSDGAVPSFFPELNSGVSLLRRSELQRSFISSWLNLYDELYSKFQQSWDQASLRSVAWHFSQFQNLRLQVLPQEANLRLTKPWVAGRGLKVCVIHGRPPEEELDAFIHFLNHDFDRFRTWSEWISLYPNSQIRPRHDRTFS